MARYTEKLTATIKYWYEETDRPIESIANDFDVCARNIQRMASTGNWNRRRDRKRKPRDVPPANLLLAEAMGLAAASVSTRHPEVRAQRASKGDGPSDSSDYGPPPSRLGAARLAPQDDGDNSEPATNLSAAERLEALVVKQIEAVEQSGAALVGRRTTAAAADRRARTLSTLTQTLHTLQRLRAGENPEQEKFNDDFDDRPRDIDEFRRALARRIDAFVASRTNGGVAGGQTGLKPLADAG